MLLDLCVDVGRGRWPGPKDGSGADGEGKGQRVAEPVGKKQLGNREGPVVCRHPEDALRVAGDRVDDVVVKVDGAFGETGRTGGVQPEGGIIFAGRLCLERCGGGEQLVEVERASGRRAVDH